MRVGHGVQIPTSPDGLSEGDFYMDVPALAAVLGMNVSDLDGVEYYGDAASGDIYLTFDGYFRMYFGADPAVHNCMVEITGTGTGTQPTGQKPSIWAKVVSFFLRILDFLKKMFGTQK